jgi:hypothetical protein
MYLGAKVISVLMDNTVTAMYAEQRKQNTL